MLANHAPSQAAGSSPPRRSRARCCCPSTPAASRPPPRGLHAAACGHRRSRSRRPSRPREQQCGSRPLRGRAPARRQDQVCLQRPRHPHGRPKSARRGEATTSVALRDFRHSRDAALGCESASGCVASGEPRHEELKPLVPVAAVVVARLRVRWWRTYRSAAAESRRGEQRAGRRRLERAALKRGLGARAGHPADAQVRGPQR